MNTQRPIEPSFAGNHDIDWAVMLWNWCDSCWATNPRHHPTMAIIYDALVGPKSLLVLRVCPLPLRSLLTILQQMSDVVGHRGRCCPSDMTILGTYLDVGDRQPKRTISKKRRFLMYLRRRFLTFRRFHKRQKC